MIKKVFYLALILCVSGSCFAQKSKTSKALVPEKLPKTIAYSDGFKHFWQALSEESRGLKSLADYMPSNTMKRIFIFVVMPDGQQGIEGHIQVISQFFDAWTFEELGGYLTYIDEGIYQFKMPIKSLVPMLEIQGIVQVDIPRKVRVKK